MKQAPSARLVLRALCSLITLGAAASTLAAPLPAATTSTPCNQSSDVSQSCQLFGGGGQYAGAASLEGRSASGSFDVATAYSTFPLVSQVRYFVELLSSSGSFAAGTVPIVVGTTGLTEVGGSGISLVGTAFNGNEATASVRAFGRSWFACSGPFVACGGNAATSFGGVFVVDVRPNSSASSLGLNVYEVSVEARVAINSNMSSSFARAFADPVIFIDPAYQLAHPEVSLAFSANIGPPIPEPSTWALMLLGLLPLWLRASKGRGG